MINVKKSIVMLAEFFGTALSENQVNMYAAVLSKIDEDLLRETIGSIMENSKFTRFPLPAQILAEAGYSSRDQNSKAKELASKIIQAVSKFGWSNQAEAMAFIGPIGEDIVRRWGGWAYVCQNLGTTIDLTTFQAQIRDLAEAQFKSFHRNDNEHLQIESKKDIGLLVNKIIKPV